MARRFEKREIKEFFYFSISIFILVARKQLPAPFPQKPEFKGGPIDANSSPALVLEYKDYMRKKLKYEEWQNSILLNGRKLQDQNKPLFLQDARFKYSPVLKKSLQKDKNLTDDDHFVKLICEFSDTEEQYLSDLNILIDYYLVPLKIYAQQHPNSHISFETLADGEQAFKKVRDTTVKFHTQLANQLRFVTDIYKDIYLGKLLLEMVLIKKKKKK